MEYIEKLIGLHNEDPREWQDNNRKCELCDKDAEIYDEYCEDHQACYYCGEHDNTCDCEINETIKDELEGRKEMDKQDQILEQNIIKNK
mgnify:CR=1 FL=1